MVALDPITIIGTLGFPIFVSLWFMYRNEKVLKEHTEALFALKDVIKEICIEIRSVHGKDAE